MWKNKLLTTIKKYSIISALFAQIPELARRSLAKPSRYRLMVRTSGFHPGNRGSIPRSGTKT